MNAISEILRGQPELAIFLSLALGFFLGKFRVGNFTLGPVLGTLFAGLLIGQLDISIPAIVKVIFFDLFLFATGFKVGPQFFQGLKKDALPQLVLTFVICLGALFTAYYLSKMMRYDAGTAAGLLAGAFTESTLIGTASEAIARLPISEGEKIRLINNIPISYTVTYLIGTTSVVWFLPQIAPLLLRINLREMSRKLEVKLLGNSESEPGVASAFDDWDLRAFKVTGEQWTGLTVKELENSVSVTEGRIIVERIRRQGKIVESHPELVIAAGDTIAVASRQQVMIKHLSGIGIEVFDRELLDFPRCYLNIVITKKAMAGKTLLEIAQNYGQGVMLNKIIRSGLELPFDPGTIINRGDILQVAGRKDDLERAAKQAGYLDRPSVVTDIMFVSLGILIGGLIGLLSVKFFGISITLTTSGGALVMGLFLGWLRSRRPTFGRIPDAALWIFDTLGLSVFIGAVGISAGPGFIAGLRQTGFSILGVGLAVALLPHIVGLLVGHFVLKINPVILLGAQSGAGTNTTALKALQDKAGSKLPVLGYTIPYALGNILLTAWGPVIVALMS
jgi:putative transport protein